MVLGGQGKCGGDNMVIGGRNRKLGDNIVIHTQETEQEKKQEAK